MFDPPENSSDDRIAEVPSRVWDEAHRPHGIFEHIPFFPLFSVPRVLQLANSVIGFSLGRSNAPEGFSANAAMGPSNLVNVTPRSPNPLPGVVFGTPASPRSVFTQGEPVNFGELGQLVGRNPGALTVGDYGPFPDVFRPRGVVGYPIPVGVRDVFDGPTIGIIMTSRDLVGLHLGVQQPPAVRSVPVTGGVFTGPSATLYPSQRSVYLRFAGSQGGVDGLPQSSGLRKRRKRRRRF